MIIGCPASTSNVEKWFEGDRNETLAICRSLALALAAAIGEKPAGRFMHDPQPHAGGAALPASGYEHKLTDGMRCARVPFNLPQ